MMSKPYCEGFFATMIAARMSGTYSRVSRGRYRELLDSAQKSSSPERFIARCTPPKAAVVGREHQVPVAVEQLVKRLQIARRSDGRLLGIRALVDIPVGLQPLLGRRRPHELPRPPRAGLRQRVGLEAALDDRNVGEIERQPFGAEHRLDHRQVLRAARQALVDVVAQPPLEELDIRQDALVLRNGHVVFGGREVGA